MVEKIIREKVASLTVTDIETFASKNNIVLNSSELNNILEIIKNNWYDLVYGDSNNIFTSNRSKVSEDNYMKIEQLFNCFKKKYQKFL